MTIFSDLSIKQKPKMNLHKGVFIFMAIIMLLYGGCRLIPQPSPNAKIQRIIAPTLNATLKMGVDTDKELEALSTQLDEIEGIQDSIDQLSVKLSLKLDAISAKKSYDEYNSDSIAKSEQEMDMFLDEVSQAGNNEARYQ